MKKLFNISLVVLVLTVIANIVFLCQPVYNGEYKSSDEKMPKFTFNQNIATINDYYVGAVKISDNGNVKISLHDDAKSWLGSSFGFERISVFTLKYDDWSSDSDGMKYSCQEAINCQIALSVVTVLSFVGCIITANKSIGTKSKEN